MGVSDLYNKSEWLKAEDLKGQSVVLTIESVEVKELDDGKERKLEVSFQGTDKALLLNTTNARSIADMYGDAYEGGEWNGKAIELFTMPVNYQGRMMQGIRVKAPAQAAAPPEPPKADGSPATGLPF